MGIRQVALPSSVTEFRPSLAFRRGWLFLGWLMVGFVIWASLTSQPPQAPDFLAWDKAQHFVAYAVMAYWFGSLSGATHLYPLWLIGLGIGLEYLQDFGGVRVKDYFDMLANSLGCLAGWAMAATRLGRFIFRLDGLVAKFLVR